jgi:hypothetical protein
MNKDSYPIIEKKYKLTQDPRNDVQLVDFINEDMASIPIRVQGHILFYGHNSDFIIINQKPTDSIIMENEENLNYDEQNEKTFKSSFNQYFILKIKSDSVYGPFEKKEYLEFRKKLNIPEKLKLNNSTLNFYVSGQRNDIDYHENLDPELIEVKNLKGNEVAKMIFPFSLFE